MSAPSTRTATVSTALPPTGWGCGRATPSARARGRTRPTLPASHSASRMRRLMSRQRAFRRRRFVRRGVELHLDLRRKAAVQLDAPTHHDTEIRQTAGDRKGAGRSRTSTRSAACPRTRVMTSAHLVAASGRTAGNMYVSVRISSFGGPREAERRANRPLLAPRTGPPGISHSAPSASAPCACLRAAPTAVQRVGYQARACRKGRLPITNSNLCESVQPTEPGCCHAKAGSVEESGRRLGATAGGNLPQFDPQPHGFDHRRMPEAVRSSLQLRRQSLGCAMLGPLRPAVCRALVHRLAAPTRLTDRRRSGRDQRAISRRNCRSSVAPLAGAFPRDVAVHVRHQLTGSATVLSVCWIGGSSCWRSLVRRSSSSARSGPTTTGLSGRNTALRKLATWST